MENDCDITGDNDDTIGTEDGDEVNISSSSISGDDLSESDFEDRSESEDDDAGEFDINHPLYPGGPLSVGESMIAILLFATRHKLSVACISDLLRLIFVHCILSNDCVKTYYRFKNFFDRTTTPLTRHYYCSQCYKTLESQVSRCQDCAGSLKGCFIEIPVISQLNKLYSRPGFFKDLQRRFVEENQNSNNSKDIYDGEVYKSMSYFLSSIFNISFTWFTDSVSIFESSKYSIWPFYLITNELPFTHRFLLNFGSASKSLKRISS